MLKQQNVKAEEEEHNVETADDKETEAAAEAKATNMTEQVLNVLMQNNIVDFQKEKLEVASFLIKMANTYNNELVTLKSAQKLNVSASKNK